MTVSVPNTSENLREARMLPVAENTRDNLDRLLGNISNPLVQGPHLTSELTRLTALNEVDQEAEDMDELRAMAARLRDSHNELTSEIARAGGGRPYLARKLKKEERMWDKYVEHGFTHKKTGDVVRTRIHFGDLGTLYRAVVELYKRAKIVRVKDRFINPRSSGYRDLLFNIELKDPDTGKSHITEIQFQLDAMHDAKRSEYPNYIKIRALEQELEYYRINEPDETGKIRKLEEKIAHLQRVSQDIFNEAWSPYEGKLEVGKKEVA